jgi:pimeloyl-ACP methyl ester carboxylesterase
VASLPRGDGHPVVVFPGLGVSGAATSVLRVRLLHLGYEVYDWEQGINTGPGANFSEWIRLLEEHLQRIYAQHGRRISLIGWSLGGIYARELGKRHPRLIRQVVTLATPFGDNPEAINAMNIFAPLNGEVPDLAAADRVEAESSVPSTSIYSQTDGIVAWQACVGPESKRHRNIEVNGVSHMGMTTHPDVLQVLAQLLKK